jgi:hypothetical protein
MTGPRLRTTARGSPIPSFPSVRGPLLQRKCACGGTPGPTGECESCRKKRESGTLQRRADHPSSLNPHPFDVSPIAYEALRSPGAPLNASTQQRFGLDFSRVQIHSQLHGAPTQSTSVDGGAAISSVEASDGIFIDGPDKGATPKSPAPPPAAKPQTPPAKAAKCPTDVQVINIDQIKDTDLGKGGFLTGIGAIAYMEVSDSSGKDWDGTNVQESVKKTKNTCGHWAKPVCSNESGDSDGLTVGAKIKALGQIEMPALRNVFYDMHIFALRTASVLHQLDKSECEVQCQQSYQCGGKQFGPEFIITYMTKKDTIAKTYDVTRVKVKKEAKATPAAGPANP